MTPNGNYYDNGVDFEMKSEKDVFADSGDPGGVRTYGREWSGHWRWALGATFPMARLTVTFHHFIPVAREASTEKHRARRS